ncbi:MAG TPA: ABC transporter permease [Anaerolineae bacterium]|jgi:ABC-2 type transport system permease protein|nr:ABC transporter permease [Anaerolineae bacterium]
MKLLDVTLKDLVQSSRSYMVYIFAFVIPILVTGLFVLMFGGIGGDDESFALPRTTVVIVNLDEGQMPAGSGAFADLGLDMPQGAEAGFGEADSFGDVLSMILKSEVFADFMTVSDEVDERAARAAVDNQQAGVAIFIPANFTAAMIQPGETADVLFYQDPTLPLGPAIVESIVRQLLDNFSAGTIAIGVAINGLLQSGIVPDQALISDLVGQVTSAQSGGQGSEDGQPPELLEIQLPPGTESSGSIVTDIIGVILGGMMVFFVFYTAAAAVQTILTEEERGTLARLFTTPTSHGSILGGKTLAGVVTVIIQMTVLMVFGALLFNVFWGELPTVLMAVAGIILVSAATGLFLTSLMQNTRQGGIIFGGVLTVTGMLGLVPVFTAGVPNQPESLQIVSLLVPQGWAMRGLTISMDGGTIVDIVPVFAGLLAWTLVLGFIGQRRLQKRFA